MEYRELQNMLFKFQYRNPGTTCDFEDIERFSNSYGKLYSDPEDFYLAFKDWIKAVRAYESGYNREL